LPQFNWRLNLFVINLNVLFSTNPISSAFENETMPSTFHRGFDDFTFDQLTLEGISTDDTYPKQSGFSICIKFDKILINFFKPSNEFVLQMRKLFCASADYMLIKYTVEKDRTQSYTLIGQDSSITIRLPRFTKIVYFQQLWMEVLDYFFEAIIGSEVIFGKRREHPPDPIIAVPSLSGEGSSNASELHWYVESCPKAKG
jgi:hypothetical protein